MKFHWLAAAALLALAACGRGGQEAKQQEEPAAPPAGARFTAGDPPQTPGPGASGALGSGCAPGEGDLPDGAWLGHARAWDAGGIDLDLVCMYVGEAAARESAARGEDAPNEFYIVNENTDVRRVVVAPGSPAWQFTDETGGISLKRDLYADLVRGPRIYQTCPGEWCLVWVYVNDGRATEVMQQYVP